MILVFDTSTSHLSIGLATDSGELLRSFTAEATAQERGIHDARLARETEKLLLEVHAKARDISRIGLIIGPGSFTGLRIGLSFAKGLAFANGAGIALLTQHEVLKAGYNGDAGYIVTQGYRPDQLYLAVSNEPRNISLLNVSEVQNLPPRPIIAHVLLDAAVWQLRPVASLEIMPSIMARMTAESTEIISGTSIDALEPLYLTEFKTT